MLKYSNIVYLIIPLVFASILCKADTFAKVFPEPKEPYVVITANKKILNNGDKVKITVFLVNPTDVNVKIRCANLFREDGSPVDGIVGFSFLEDGKDFAVPRGKNSSYANIGDRLITQLNRVRK